MNYIGSAKSISEAKPIFLAQFTFAMPSVAGIYPRGAPDSRGDRLAPNVTELGAGDIGGKTLTPGVYKWSSGLLIPTDVTLAGSATDVWIFQIAQKLTMANGKRIVLSGGALAKNVFWQVSGLVDLGTTVQFEGIVLSQTSIALRNKATVNGRLLAGTAITIDGSTVREPAP